MNPNPRAEAAGSSFIYVPTLEDRIRYREAGIQTAIEYPQWYALEPSKGQYDFSHVEEILRLNREAGMKTIFAIPGFVNPEWMPDEWFIKSIEGKIDRRVLSFWNIDAQAYLIHYCVSLIKKYGAEDVLFIFSESENGENNLPTTPSFYDDHALAEYRSIYGSLAYPDINNITSYPQTKEWLRKSALAHHMELQGVFYPQKKEIWNMMQWLYDQWSKATLNFVQLELMQLYKQVWRDVEIVLLQYTFFDDAHTDENAEYVDRLMKKTPCQVIVEAHFASGLKITTPQAIAKGFRGQIICPTHPQSGKNKLEQWMLEEIKKSNELWLQSTGQ
jgi:hypothetical protein